MTERGVSGIVVPFGVPGTTSKGRTTFAPGSISWAEQVDRVKLLIEHSQGVSIGHASRLEERPGGLWGRFVVDGDDPTALAALRQAFRKVRDGFSIGIEFDDATTNALARTPMAAAGVPGVGVLREVSLVSVPAFDDARVDDVFGLVEDDTHQLPAAAAAGAVITTTGAPMSPKLVTAGGRGLATAASPTGLDGLALADAGAGTSQAINIGGAAPAAPGAPAAAPAPATAAGNVDATAAAAGAQAPQATASAPAAPETPAAPPLATAGAVHTAHDAPVYTFDGVGHSMVRDLFAVRTGQDFDGAAAGRLASFSRAMNDDRSAQLATYGAAILATSAVETRGTAWDNITPDVYRPDLVVRAIDQGRPLTSRVRQVPITGPNPFRLPTLGNFDGVEDHTEGEAHAAEGTLDDAGNQVVVPSAVSGAWRASRELVESTTPGIDRIAVEEMVKDYRQQSEARLVAKLETVKAVHDATAVDTPAELIAALITHYSVRRVPPSVLGMGWGAFAFWAALQASDGRPYFPAFGPSNATGTVASGFTSLNINGIPGAPAWSADSEDMWSLVGDDVVVFESAPRTFRFEEVEGPGVIKFAIWGYQAAHVYRTEGVRRLNRTA